jgi:hypothetical protein
VLAFDSDEINAIVKDLALLKQLFHAKMESKTPEYPKLLTSNFDDKERGQPNRALPRQGPPERVFQSCQGDIDSRRDLLSCWRRLFPSPSRICRKQTSMVSKGCDDFG